MELVREPARLPTAVRHRAALAGRLSTLEDWRLTPVPQGSDFAAATAVTRAEGGAVAAVLDPGWDVGGNVLNGGYLLAVAARAAVLDSPHPHPVALSASYLRATGPGPVVLDVVPGPAGRTLAHASVTLRGPDGPSLAVQATSATLGADAPLWGAPPPDAAPVEECLASDGTVVGRPTEEVALRHRVETRLDPATAGWLRGEPSGEPVMRAWVRLAAAPSPTRSPSCCSPTCCRRPLGDGPVRLGATVSSRCWSTHCRRPAGAWSRPARPRSRAAGWTRTTGSGTPPAGWSRRAGSSPARRGEASLQGLAASLRAVGGREVLQAFSRNTVAGSARSAARWA